MIAARADELETRQSPAFAALEAGLAVAARHEGTSFVAIPAPFTHANALVDAWPSEVAVAWASATDDVVGIGIAHEVRGHGDARWQQVIDGARAVKIGHVDPTVRPRWFGGAAFAPSAADRAPWLGFGDAWFVLPRWTYERGVLVLAVARHEATDGARWQAELAIHLAALADPSTGRGQPAVVELGRASAAQWRDQVVAITDAIARGECSKIVAARTCNVVLGGAVRPGELLSALDERHGDCVRLAIRPPGAGMLVAATPERLVKREGMLVEVDALAGTISQGGDAATLLASSKDRNEHQLVVDAIAGALRDAGATFEIPAQPEIRALRHLLHLHTAFRATLHEPRHVLELAARLHPTPAVGGTPQRLAIEWIRDREPVARGWYAAPVGWFDLDGNGELAVAIRSGVLAGNRAWLWAGAGIVAGSDPDRELAETEAKLRAMLGALGAIA